MLTKTILTILLIFNWNAYAQSIQYTYTENGNLIFSDVISADSLSQENLYNRSVEIYTSDYKVKKNNKDKTIKVSKTFTLHEKGIISKIPIAEVQYLLFLEFKDQRYRYQLKDFEYLPYERNRYGKFEIVQRKRKSLESVIKNTSEWDDHREAFANKINGEIEDLTLLMKSQQNFQSNDTVSNVIKLEDKW